MCEWGFVLIFVLFGLMVLFIVFNVRFLFICVLVKGRFLGIVFFLFCFLINCLIMWFFNEWNEIIINWLLGLSILIVVCSVVWIFFNLLLI